MHHKLIDCNCKNGSSYNKLLPLLTSLTASKVKFYFRGSFVFEEMYTAAKTDYMPPDYTFIYDICNFNSLNKLNENITPLSEAIQMAGGTYFIFSCNQYWVLFN